MRFTRVALTFPEDLTSINGSYFVVSQIHIEHTYTEIVFQKDSVSTQYFHPGVLRFLGEIQMGNLKYDPLLVRYPLACKQMMLTVGLSL